MIVDRVVTDIIHADLVVADLTDLNPNAFYELGIRHSTEKPTIHVAKSGTPLPFDALSHRTIFIDLTDWHNIERSRLQLADSARLVKDPGFQVSNPITQANASFKMRESADPRDRVIAELRERITSLEMRSQELRLPIRDQAARDQNAALQALKNRGEFHAVEKIKSIVNRGISEAKSVQEIISEILKEHQTTFGTYNIISGVTTSDETIMVKFEGNPGNEYSFSLKQN
jgi:hypothetical protein